MATRDILSDYGPDRKEGGKRATSGGRIEAKDLPYCPPVGPKGQWDKGPGLHGTNHGNSGTQRKG